MSHPVLYSDPHSSNVWRVSIYLHEKGLKPEIKDISLMKGENKTPEYLAVNPRHQVPAWTDGDVVIAESLAIISYLESKHKEKPLIPANDKDHALCLTRYFQYPNKLDSLGIAGAALFGKKNKEDLKDKIVALLKELEQWNKALEGREYFANTFSIADIAPIPLISSSVQILGLDLAQFPHLQAWYNRVWERPSVKDTAVCISLLNQIPHERVLEGAKL